MKQPKKNNFGSMFLWWKIDPLELTEQVTQYHTLGFNKSARKISTLLLMFSCAITLSMILFFNADEQALADVGMMAVLSIFVYRGHKTALVLAMIYWTGSKGYSMLSTKNPMMPIIWWVAYMKYFYLAFRVGRNPKPQIPNDSTIIEEQKSAV